MNIYTNKFNNQTGERVKKFFENKNFSFGVLQYANWQAKNEAFTASFYNSGKFVLQGKDVSLIAAELEEFLNENAGQKKLLTVNLSQRDEEIIVPAERYIGTDESGKGDFFGPLVTASVCADGKLREFFEEIGVKDSKKLDDAKIMKLAAQIKNNAPFSIVVVTPEKYNQLYNSFKNLNKLLAWTHARAIENVLEKSPCECAVSDKFGNEKFIQNALLEKGSKINLIQTVRGERDLTVAAASVVARAEFVKRFSDMCMKYDLKFPKGASNAVIQTGMDFCKKFGKENLKSVAKLHFKTTFDITASAATAD